MDLFGSIWNILNNFFKKLDLFGTSKYDIWNFLTAIWIYFGFLSLPTVLLGFRAFAEKDH